MRTRPIIAIFKKARWSPYVAGALIGVVSWFSVLTTGKYLGVSSTFVRTIGMIESIFTPERVASSSYFVKEKPIVDWQWMEVLGILIGAFIAAKLSGDFQIRSVPPMWEKRFGSSRFAEAFPFLKDNVLKWGDLGKLTLPIVLGVNHWIVIAIVWAVAIGILLGLETKRL